LASPDGHVAHKRQKKIGSRRKGAVSLNTEGEKRKGVKTAGGGGGRYIRSLDGRQEGKEA